MKCAFIISMNLIHNIIQRILWIEKLRINENNRIMIYITTHNLNFNEIKWNQRFISMDVIKYNNQIT